MSNNNVMIDVIVIGGGPAGSTAAALLAERGWRVTVLEKDHHPRFHIGESLLPLNLPLFEQLGVFTQVQSIGVPKYGAEFGLSHTSQRRSTYFRRAYDQRYTQAFQVRRAEFDALLLRNSVAKGATVIEGVTVKQVAFGSTGVTVNAHHSATGETDDFRARYIVDASGRGTLLARQLKLKEKNPHHQSAAVYGHFNGVERLAGEDAGNVSIYWFEHGWFWLIPLPEGVMSVGAACWPEYLKTRAQRSLEQFLWDTIALCPAAQQRMQDAHLVSGMAVQGTGNYAYRAKRMRGERYVLLGDAFAFIDPVFSTGVYLAMSSAARSVPAIDAWLHGDLRAAKTQFRQFECHTRRSISNVAWFIYRFTSPALQHLFMNPRNLCGIEQAVTSLLAGDLHHRRLVWPLTVFKCIYWLHTVAFWSRSWAAYRLRRRNANWIEPSAQVVDDLTESKDIQHTA